MLFLATAPRPMFFLAWLAFVPLLRAHRNSTVKMAFLLGWVAGIVANFGNFYWIYELVVAHSAIPAVGGILVTLLLAIQQGLKEAIWLGAARYLGDKLAPAAFTYSVVYVAVEFLYPIIFPIHLGDTQAYSLYTRQVMDIAGPAGLSAVIMAFNLTLFQFLDQKRRPRYLAAAAAILVGTLGYGYARVVQYDRIIARADKIRVGMVENNIGVGQTTMETARRQIMLAAQLAATENPDLIVFPETAIKTPPPTHKVGDFIAPSASSRFYPLSMTESAQNEIYSVQQGYNTPVLFGSTAIDPDRPGPVPGRPALFNGAFLLDENGKVLGTALKNKLLMFGEYVPGSSWFPWIYSEVLTKASALYPGEQPSAIPFNGHKIGVSICYEDILPGFSYELLQKKPNLLVNLTNDGWFGKTAEPYTHLALAQARAVESRLFMVRSTCTGVSAYIDPLGRVLSQSDIDEPEVMVAEVAWLKGGSLFSVIGLYFPWLCVLLTVSSIWWTRRSRKGYEAPKRI